MGYEYIEITGAKALNLKNVNLRIPKEQITILTGESDSDKSSILQDIRYL
jgi:excinuclease ABC subunit A